MKIFESLIEENQFITGFFEIRVETKVTPSIYIWDGSIDWYIPLQFEGELMKTHFDEIKKLSLHPDSKGSFQLANLYAMRILGEIYR